MRPSLLAIRSWLKTNQFDAFILPRGDAYLGEYVAPHDEMLAWLTGFTGSAGFAIVTAHAAYLYTDGRYQTQGAEELKNSGFELRHSARDKWTEDLAAAIGVRTLAFDPWLHSIEWHSQTEKKLSDKKITLRAVAQNPIDNLWQNRPAPPSGKTEPHPMEFSGEGSADKCTRLGAKLFAQNIDAEFVNDPTLVAWLLNIRGRDVPHIPIAQCRAILYAAGHAELLTPNMNLSDRMAELKGKTLRLPATNTPYKILEMAKLSDVKPDTSASVISPARAIKNETEISGTRVAHGRDGAALAAAFAKIKPGMSEFEIAQLLARHRAAQPDYVEESFPAIVGWNGNGAIVHYRPHETDSAKISGNGILLIDSGGQYLCGTTDITRTIAIGTPTARQKEIYTRVLKGHLAIARAQFPVGTTGAQLDALARQYLWDVGLDYDHGTGHGVGSFLSVHEGPQSISNRPNPTALEPGMILSNEPGCYLPAEFGVRIENLILVRSAAQPNFLCFETLTRVPYDHALIDTALLTQEEIKQIDDYHQLVKSDK